MGTYKRLGGDPDKPCQVCESDEPLTNATLVTQICDDCLELGGNRVLDAETANEVRREREAIRLRAQQPSGGA